MIDMAFLVVQRFILAFFLLHGWIPLGPLNDVSAFGAAPELVSRYQAMFGNTHAFLPVRHGIVPNTAHVILHFATLTAFLSAVAVALR
ncbi:MAG: hypothetical protein IMX05_02540 [Hydrogenibacillus schlegelii]|nr:hypothetical protein [Hydrogenibacillus schlegelii]